MIGYLIALLVVCGLSSCKKDVEGCRDPQALNYNPDATKDDGTCEYPSCDTIICQNGGTCNEKGICICDQCFEGNRCQTQIASKFVGFYEATDNCFPTQKYLVNIFTSSNGCRELIINNLYDTGANDTVVATIRQGKNIDILQQSQGKLQFRGSGSLDPLLTELTINYTVRDSGVFYDCAASLIRQ